MSAALINMDSYKAIYIEGRMSTFVEKVNVNTLIPVISGKSEGKEFFRK